jgi:hypothetical protein
VGGREDKPGAYCGRIGVKGRQAGHHGEMALAARTPELIPGGISAAGVEGGSPGPLWGGRSHCDTNTRRSHRFYRGSYTGFYTLFPHPYTVADSVPVVPHGRRVHPFRDRG